MIVKVQLSVFTTAMPSRQQALIYDSARTTYFSGAAPEWIKTKMGTALKAYFHAEIIAGAIRLNDQAPDQPW